MDSAHEIKLRLPIEQLVSQYTQVIKKGRQLKCICPFHNDKHPSMLISPEKGIAYCFACNNGGDIFTFYQKIEGVDFVQALKDLAEQTGVTLEESTKPSINKDEKARIKECIAAAQTHFTTALTASEKATQYLQKRGIEPVVIKQFGLGYASDSGTQLHQALLKQGFSQSEIVKAGLASERDMGGALYDRFRDRLMFPIADTKGDTIAFGGRTLGDDPAKYINSPEGILYSKSHVLYGYHLAKDAIREQKSVVLVEGYFDVIACHRAGIHNAVAVSGTALTEQHVALLKRLVDSVVLCLDQDDAGKKAALRSFELCSKEDIEVLYATINGKDPDEALAASKDQFVESVTAKAEPYIQAILQQFANADVKNLTVKKQILSTVLPLIKARSSAVERSHYLQAMASLLRVEVSIIEQDLAQLHLEKREFIQKEETPKPTEFNAVDLAIGTFLLFPKYKHLITQLIEPIDPMHAAIVDAIKAKTGVFMIDELELETLTKERAHIIALYCESLDWLTWSDLLITVNIKKQCQFANQFLLKQKIKQANTALVSAEKEGKAADVLHLQTSITKELELRRKAERT